MFPQPPSLLGTQPSPSRRKREDKEFTVTFLCSPHQKGHPSWAQAGCLLSTELDLLCHSSCATEGLGQHTQPPGQCYTHLGIKQAVVRGKTGSLVAELSGEGRGLRGQEVLSDAHCAYQALHLCQGGSGQESQWRLGIPQPPCPAGL